MTAWSWGANSYGQLAEGHKDDQLTPQPLSDFPSKVFCMACGGGHTLLVTDEGNAFACGSNSKGQLGAGDLEDRVTLTQISALKVKVTAVAGGWDFSLGVGDSGELYSWGSNAFGQLGDPSLPSKSTVPSCVALPERLVQVAAGLRHSVALAESGNVFCWGHAKRGQCGQQGHGQLKYTSPVKAHFCISVTLPDGVGRVVQIVAGSYHTAALTDKGVVLFWGCNKHGQAAEDTTQVHKVDSPIVLDQSMFKDEKVKTISSGWTHFLAQTENGSVYSWGRGDYGQLGRARPPENQGHSHIPGKVELPETVVRFQCGSENALFVTESGQVFSVGWNEHGLCGTGDEVNVERPTPIHYLPQDADMYIACGGGHCFAVSRKTDKG
ncbi:secretion-regulating guanine nucleotide exchange factor-like [Mya arenaria]|uniref:secretion-regulating guanine nucleotide exchange factor-like n=1 Tax=Mya arenaria TaxID=6604 RepID=UPI0022E992C0|nr:secretion-regulating guanine nucleotide exchange factor-like [Mya arenaria]